MTDKELIKDAIEKGLTTPFCVPYKYVPTPWNKVEKALWCTAKDKYIGVISAPEDDLISMCYLRHQERKYPCLNCDREDLCVSFYAKHGFIPKEHAELNPYYLEKDD